MPATPSYCFHLSPATSSLRLYTVFFASPFLVRCSRSFELHNRLKLILLTYVTLRIDPSVLEGQINVKLQCNQKVEGENLALVEYMALASMAKIYAFIIIYNAGCSNLKIHLTLNST